VSDKKDYVNTAKAMQDKGPATAPPCYACIIRSMTDRRKQHRGDDRRKHTRHRTGLTHLEDLTHHVYRRHLGEHKPGEHKSEHHGHPHKHAQE
jgi:hypothetical protein